MNGDTRENPLAVPAPGVAPVRPASIPPSDGPAPGSAEQVPTGTESAPAPARSGSRRVASVSAPPRQQVRAGAQALAAVVAVLAALGVWATYRFFVTTVVGQRLDELAFTGAEYGQGRLWQVAEPVLDVVSVAFVVVGLGAAVAVAVVRRRWVLALQVVVLVAGANLTTQLLKHQILDRPDLLEGWNGPNTLPSGHTTVAASVSVALLLATPRAWRPVVALAGAAYTAATGVSTLIGQWHRPSDVVAALLVVLAWGALVCAMTPASSLDVAPRRHRTASGSPQVGAFASPGSSVVAGLLLLAAVIAGGVAAAAGVRLVGSGSVGIAPDVGAYAAGALAVLAATAVTFALLLLLRQATARPRG
ncbi:phosphatase PAP2 family protein [Isoptericola aurantiacus]|uniref:phosphatase PAP2 family protein n=1 Tax=Isoptericola aurantiacus TaxID=3377839 RepID=UPI00383BCC63